MTDIIVFGLIDTDSETTELILAEECRRCEGSGTYADRAAKEFRRCDFCDETGLRLAFAGRDLLRFIRDYAAHPDVDRPDGELQI